MPGRPLSTRASQLTASRSSLVPASAGAKPSAVSLLSAGLCRVIPGVVQVVVEDVRGKDAQELAEQLPGLISLEGSERVARAGNARDYPHLLEKVLRAWIRLPPAFKLWCGQNQLQAQRFNSNSSVVLGLNCEATRQKSLHGHPRTFSEVGLSHKYCSC